jgi:hypothetical protein
MLADLAHTHLVRKLMASWLIKLLCRIPPLIGTKQTFEIRVGGNVFAGVLSNAKIVVFS